MFKPLQMALFVIKWILCELLAHINNGIVFYYILYIKKIVNPIFWSVLCPI